MSWKNNKGSPEERPLHYIGHRQLHEVMALQHIKKVIMRHDATLINKDEDSMMVQEVSSLTCHIWSSNTFTVVFMETGHIGCSVRNAVDRAELSRGIRIAASRALGGFMATFLHEEQLRNEGQKAVDLRDQIVPMARKNVPPLLMKIERGERDAEAQARDGLVRRDELNISEAIGGRFRY